MLIAHWATFLPLDSAFANAALFPQIPSVMSFTSTGTTDTFILDGNTRIIVDSEFGREGSPSAYDFAKTFHQDLLAVTSLVGLPSVELIRPGGPPVGKSSIHVVVDPTSMNFTLYNGKSTNEGYNLVIREDTIRIEARAPIGVWRGMTTLVQQAALAVAAGKKLVSLPLGQVSDAPGWEIRGFMLDAGRHWFDTKFLADLCAYASFFKINEMHLHASDNLWDPVWLYGDGNDNWKKLYAAFRFEPRSGSSLKGLVTRKNESWTRGDFLNMQESCAARGVTIVPEIDTPGHSLVITQWKPQLMELGTPDHLNLSHPETIPTIKAIWDEFLPWFTSLEVSIGADEYDANLANDYIAFVNEMSVFIQKQSGKSVRIWGTNEPSNTSSISTNITIQHWDFPGDDIPVQLMAKGYSIVNSEQAFLYLDGKASDGGQFPQELNQDLMWGGAPDGKGWSPNIFTTNDPSNNTGIDNPLLRGSIMALWNDWGNNATTALEIYYQLARSLAVFGEKTWAGSDARASGLTRGQFDSVYPLLNAAAPGQNLNRIVKPEHGNIVYSYQTVQNGFRTGVESVGPPYTLTFSVQVASLGPDTGVLFSGIDSKLHVSSLTFEATGQLYSLNYTLPNYLSTKVEIHATREYTYAIINDDVSSKRYWTTVMDVWGEYMQLGNMSFAAPAQVIGGEGFIGSIKDVSLVLGS
ncbi:glycoside hydrolase [Irpex rosettiformis]|uniref:Glycoside hydrolase n=1 Tax=Irpex rosettiformis TaxID=378272 RepID=A0ACB8UL60_9APHY|nr:glycoside hydrolase [Irpex rosettiformis]